MTTTGKTTTPKFRKLGTGGDYYGWHSQMKIYFESKGTWRHVSEGVEIFVDEEDEVTAEMISAKCKRDMLLSLFPDVSVTVQHLNSAHDMFVRIVKLFAGTETSQRRKIRTKLDTLKFKENYFFFLSEFESLVSQLNVLEGILSWKDTCLMFLNNLPRELAMLTHNLKTQVEDNEEENVELWTNIFDKVLSYLMDAGLYDITTRQVKNENNTKNAFATVEDRSYNKSEVRCYGCNEFGHFKKNCPKKNDSSQRSSTKKNQKNDSSEGTRVGNIATWVCNRIPVVQTASKSSTKEYCQQIFLLDSGANNHVCGDKSLFFEMTKLQEKININTANGLIVATHEGSVKILLDNNLPVILTGVLYWEGSPNLISVVCLAEKGLCIKFTKTGADILDGDSSIYSANKTADGIYEIRTKKNYVAFMSQLVWHMRLNHAGEKRLINTVGKKLLDKDLDKVNIANCDGCMKGKAIRNKISRKPSPKEYEPLELIVGDLVGPYDTSINKKKGALILTCAASNFIWCEVFAKKSEVPKLLINFFRKMERQFPGRIKTLRTDQGSEFLAHVVEDFLNEIGINHQLSTAYLHEENGRAEASNKQILHSTRALLYNAGFSKGYWPFAMKCAVFQHNAIVPTRRDYAPWALIYGGTAPLHRLCIFGIPGFAHVAAETRRKLDVTTRECYFIGYSEHNPSYMVLDKNTRRIFHCRTFYRDEETFAKKRYGSILAENGEKNTDEFDFLNVNKDTFEEQERDHVVATENIAPLQPSDPNQPDRSVSFSESIEEPSSQGTNEVDEDVISEAGSIDIEAFEEVEDNVDPNFCDVNENNIVSGRTRSQKVARGEKVMFARSYNEPNLQRLRWLMKAKGDTKGFKTYRDAVKNNDLWKKAYQDELTKLETLGEFKVIRRTPEMSPLPFIEVLTEKYDHITGKNKLKVRLAARGDLQKDPPSNVYSPTTKCEEIRLFMALMRTLGCYVEQGDCPAAYLNGRMKFPVHLLLPQGHEKKDNKNTFIYLCPASIHGLKVAGRVWYLEFKKIMEKHGFKCTMRSPCLFVLEKNGEILYLQIYVDDYLSGSTSNDLLTEVSDILKEEFKVKTTREVTKFVGLEVTFEKERMFVHQKEMIADLLEDYRISKLVDKPLVVNHKWTVSTPLDDIKRLQKIVGELSYIANISRPDISFPVNLIARRIVNGTKETFRIAKRILSYLGKTINYRIEIPKYLKEKWELKLFCDASFADCKDDKFRSTGGFICLFNNTPIAWKSKRIKLVCTSTAESEYLALYSGMKEALYYAYLLEESYNHNVWPIKVFVDNLAVIQVIQGSAPANMTKHLATKYFRLQQWFEEDLFEISYVKSEENLADIFTKQVGGQFDYLVSNILQTTGSVENTVEGLVGDTVTSRMEDRNDDASIHPLPTVAVPVPMNAQKSTDTRSNTYKDKRKVLDYKRAVALTAYDKSKKLRSYK